MELATLSANYPDEGPGPINYVLLAGDQSLFSINASNGVITLLKALDAESTNVPDQPPIYYLKVGTIEAVELQYLENGQKINLVTDPGLAHFCDIQINVVDINDWIPNFEQNLYEFTIPATAEPGTIVGQVRAFDQDVTSPNNKLFYYIIPKKNNSSIKSIYAKQFFSLNSQTGQLKTNSNLKNFAGRILRFGIQVVDGGIDGTELNSTTEIAVHLEGIRRHEEKKELTTTTISWQEVEEEKEEEKEEREEQLKEENIEKQNTRSPSDKPTTKQFVNNKKEELKISTEIVIPSESLSNIETKTPSYLNENKIKFSNHNFNSSIMEGTRPPVFLTILPVINKPSDTRFTICAIRTGNLRGAFSVAQNGEGDCELRTQMQLDREAIPNYLLNITVENGGQQDWTLANISVLDVNDNRPKFVFNKIEGERKNEKFGPESFFAVLPVETMANQRFYKITAEDGDEPGNGNSLINYSIDIEETKESEGGHLFGIDPQSGELWPKKGADELAQISKKNFFRITVIACDNPGEQKRRLCSRAPVSISILDDRHRFVLIFSGMSAEQIKQQEKEILNSLRPFTYPCSNPIIERIEVEEEEKDIKKYLKRSKEENEYLVNVILYAANLKEKKLCLKQEMKKIFFSDTKEAITAAMHQWGAELLDILENGVNNGRIILNKNKNTSIRSRPIYSAKTHDKEEIDEFSSGVTGLASLLFPIDWSNSNTINALIGIVVIITLIALVGLIALCVFRYRHRKMRRHRAEQIRRRHHQHQQQAYRIGGVGGGFHSAAGLLAAVNGAKAASNYSTHFDSGGILNSNGGIFNTTTGCGHSCLFGSNNNFYMPSNSSGTPLGVDHFEKESKSYESQMRELSVCDDENFIPRNWQNIKRNQHNCNCQEQQINTEHPSSPPSSPPSSNQKLNGSSLLLLPPPPDPPPQPPAQQRKIGRRLTNSENAPTSAVVNSRLPRQNPKHYSPPATIGLQRNHEGDFSIDESFYAANGQARYIY